MSREATLERVRRALEHRRARAEAPVVEDALVRLAGAGDDVIALFTRRAAEMGASVRTVPASGLAAAVVEILAEAGARTAVATLARLPEAEALVAEAALRGIHVLDAAATPVRAGASGAPSIEAADAGITGVDLALAESGTLVLCARPGEDRSVSLMPPVHVAVVRGSEIVPDLLDAVRRLGASALPSAVTLITGPSKTADIEGTLVTGVHGPGRLDVVVVA